MPVASELRALDIDLPAQPHVLVELSLLLAEDEINLQRVSSLIEADMALASSVLRAVNSSMYGLKGRVQTVQQAITYLGMREVAAVTYEIGLRSVFPHTTELEPIWRRAALRGVLMGRLGQILAVDAWVAHSAGLFEECGKAVLYRHAADHYRAMLRAARDDVELLTLEHAGFGVSHDALGAALCESWGLAAQAVLSVRHHVRFQSGAELPQAAPHLPQHRPTVCALSAIAHVLMNAPSTIDDAAARIAPQARLDTELVMRAAHRVRSQLEEMGRASTR